MIEYTSAGIIYNPTITASAKLAKDIEARFKQINVSSWVCSSWDEERAKQSVEGTSLLISIGGDGTILKAARIALPWAVPILSINLGKLGFLTELSAKDALHMLERFIAGEGWVDSRAMIQARLNPQKEGHGIYHALNDITIARGMRPRVISISASINGEHLDPYKADGVVISSATGSTGYNLSLGGPVLYPSCQDMVLLPIAPHLATSTPLVLSAQSKLTIRVEFDHNAILSIDGQHDIGLQSGDYISVVKSPYKTNFLRIQPQSCFYEKIRVKL